MERGCKKARRPAAARRPDGATEKTERKTPENLILKQQLNAAPAKQRAASKKPG